jgi:hypothetical protein
MRKTISLIYLLVFGFMYARAEDEFYRLEKFYIRRLGQER